VGKRALESLVRVGAFDAFGPRQPMLDAVDRLLAVSGAHFRAAEIGQMTLFGESGGVPGVFVFPAGTAGAAQRQQLQWERELLGVYISDHPLTRHLGDLSQVVTHTSSELRDAEQEQEVCVAGEVVTVRPYQTRNGKAMGFVTIEDVQGTIELVVFSRVWKDAGVWLEPGKIVLVQGKIDASRGDPKILVNSITTEFSLVRPAADSEPGGPRDGPDLPGPEAPDPGPMPAVEEIVEAIVIEAEADFEALAAPPPDIVEPKARSASTVERIPTSPAQGIWTDPALVADPEARESGDQDPRMLTIRLKSTGDLPRDARRMRRVHGLLVSYPGRDRFVFHVFEASRQYHLEFPNSTTGMCRDLYNQLTLLLGEGMVTVERLRIQ
jgi:DNA polymerase-3 subunit alpha